MDIKQALTTAQIAKRYGVTTRRILALAKARGIKGHALGGMFLWTKTQANQLKPGKSGVRTFGR